MVDRKHTHAIVILGGDLPSLNHQYDTTDALVIAADSGWEHAVALGLTPHFLVGDLDSISPASLAMARESSATIVEHPRDKDATDAELALSIAMEHTVDSIHVMSGGGDRLDHVLGALHILGTPAQNGVRTTCTAGSALIHVATTHHIATFNALVGETISLLPVGGRVHVSSTSGLRWSLSEEVLDPFSSRGISNIATETTVTVRVAEGVLFVIQPGHHSEGVAP
ncbi:MAG: thiamine diphosphokinase [Actinomycetota bacterium]